jgi:hypothetical protein
MGRERWEQLPHNKEAYSIVLVSRINPEGLTNPEGLNALRHATG